MIVRQTSAQITVDASEMKAEIVAIGSELVSGQSLDTNSQWLSQELGSLGIPVHFHTVLGDDLAENVAAFGSPCNAPIL